MSIRFIANKLLFMSLNFFIHEQLLRLKGKLQKEIKDIGKRMQRKLQQVKLRTDVIMLTKSEKARQNTTELMLNTGSHIMLITTRRTVSSSKCLMLKIIGIVKGSFLQSAINQVNRAKRGLG